MSAQALGRIDVQMAVYDDLTDEEALLVQQYGFKRAMHAVRQFYGRLAEAEAYLEAERAALQAARWGNIRKNGPS